MERTDATPHMNTAHTSPASGPVAAERQGSQSGLPTGALPPFPIVEAPARALRGARLDADGVPIRRAGRAHVVTYDPRAITRYALAQWNRYVTAQDARARAAFLTQAQWLAAHAVALPAEGCGWPVPLPRPAERAWGPWLSAPVQTAAIAVLARAHQLTGEDAYLSLARRAAGTLSRDILDGGVLAPVGGQAIWLEEVAVYPAGHTLHGMLQASIGLHDIAALLEDPTLPTLIGQAHDSLHRLLEYFETGYWTRADLLRGHLASAARHRQHARLLGVLARYTGCAQCAAIAQRWQRLLHRPDARARFILARGASASGRGLLRLYRRVFLRAAPPPAPTRPRRMSIPISAYPVAGGMRAVLATWRATMAGNWQMEFLTRAVGPDPDGQVIHSFGVQRHQLRFKATSPAHFPVVWLYGWVGYRALRRLLRAPASSGYSVVLPQDGLCTAAYAGVAARLAGVPVIPVDHGNVHALFNPEWHRELLAPLRRRALPRRVAGEISLRLYWRSLRLLARLSSRLMEHALVASDDIAEAYQRHLKVPAHRVTRFPFVVDVHRYAPVAEATRAAARAGLGVPADAIVVVMVNRLAPEKDLETAVAAIHATYTRLPEEMRPRLRVLIAGEGPLRARVEGEIARLGLDSICRLTGEASMAEVATLLSLSDIFLYTGRRGINSMAILEAMSAGCAVVGTTSTRHIADYLADGRGRAVPAGDVVAVSDALHELVTQAAARTRAGQLARDYVLRYHTAEALRRCLWRVTGWSLDVTTPRPIAVPPPPQEEAAQHDHIG